MGNHVLPAANQSTGCVLLVEPDETCGAVVAERASRPAGTRSGRFGVRKVAAGETLLDPAVTRDGDRILIDGEEMEVTSIDFSTNVLTVTRDVNGVTPVAPSSGDPAERANIAHLSDIEDARLSSPESGPRRR